MLVQREEYSRVPNRGRWTSDDAVTVRYPQDQQTAPCRGHERIRSAARKKRTSAGGAVCLSGSVLPPAAKTPKQEDS